ncbi:MAG: hypothetical protein KF805_07625 [Phycisphaeraceae bacterium]|nr:hypothetical protein [Phycisphaeraceae bacterium]
MKLQSPVRWTAAATASCLSTLAAAGLSQSAITSPGGFVQAGADPSTSGGSGWPGADLTSWSIGGAGSMLAELAFAGNGTASRSASASGTNISNNSDGLVGMGYAKFNAFNSAPNNSFFPMGIVNGGWKETFMVSNAALTGQNGFMQFTVHVTGSLFATGFAGSTATQITGYKDNSQLMSNSLFSPGNSTLISTDRQYGNWSLSTSGNPNSDSKAVNGTVTFAVPITFGTSFTLGVYGYARGSMRSSSGVGGISTGRASNIIITWGGISNIYFNGSPIGGSTVSSSTGINWGQPIQPPAPCPGDLNGDNQVDDSDFSIFAGAYNILDCADPSMPAGCPADLNGDGFVDDADFVLFVAAYNDLLCP